MMENKELDKIRPVNKEEAQIISDKFQQFAIAIQTVFNAIQRQALTNIGIAALHRGKINPLNFSSLTNGLGSRFMYQGIATYPSLQVRQYLNNHTNLPDFSINFATTVIETALGVLLEVHSKTR